MDNRKTWEEILASKILQDNNRDEVCRLRSDNQLACSKITMRLEGIPKFETSVRKTLNIRDRKSDD